jgi:tetratricopeptide (TPR) repeat protein
MTQAEEAKREYEEGMDAYRAGEYEEALKAFAQARDLFAGEGDQTGEIEALGSLGAIHIELEQWDEAQQFLDEALTLSTDSQDRSNQAKVLGNLGMMYARQGDAERAAEAYEQAIGIFRDLGDRGNEKAVMRQMSKLKLKKGRFLDAVGDYQEALDDKEQGGAQQVARKLFQLIGRFAGGGSPEEGVEDDKDAGDIIDMVPESDEEDASDR